MVVTRYGATIDAVWKIRRHRAVFGMFIVEGDGAGAVPSVWTEATRESMTAETWAKSFPQRGVGELQQIASCFLGVTTWQQVCTAFAFVFAALPVNTDSLEALIAANPSKTAPTD